MKLAAAAVLLVFLTIAGVLSDNAYYCADNQQTWSPDLMVSWQAFCPSWSMCAGTLQSPINIRSQNATIQTGSPILQTNYSSWITASLVHSSRYIEATLASTTTMNTNRLGGGSFGSTGYVLSSFHFLAPSEHTIDGVQYPLEGQYVHVNPSNSSDVVTVSVLYQLGGISAFPPPLPSTLLQVMGMVPMLGNTTSGVTLPLAGTWPATTSYFQYQGSSTQPPCQQNVNWLVLYAKLNVTQAQIDQLVNYAGRSNSRAIQNQNGRLVTLYTNGDDIPWWQKQYYGVTVMQGGAAIAVIVILVFIGVALGCWIRRRNVRQLHAWLKTLERQQDARQDEYYERKRQQPTTTTSETFTGAAEEFGPPETTPAATTPSATEGPHLKFASHPVV